MLNKVLVSLCAFSLTYITVIPVYAATYSFPDVTSSSPYYDSVQLLKNRGIISGAEDGNFYPEVTVKRAELLKMVYNVTVAPTACEDGYAGCSGMANDCNYCFSDIPASTWYGPYVKWAQDNNIVLGYPDGSFKPFWDVNNVEVLKIVYNSMGFTPPTLESWQRFNPEMNLENERLIYRYANAIFDNRPYHKHIPIFDYSVNARDINGIPRVNDDIKGATCDCNVKLTDWYAPYVQLSHIIDENDEFLRQPPDEFIPSQAMTRGDVAIVLAMAINWSENNGKMDFSPRTDKTEVLPTPTNISFDGIEIKNSLTIANFSFDYQYTPTIGGYSYYVLCGDEWMHMSATKEEAEPTIVNGRVHVNQTIGLCDECMVPGKRIGFTVQATEGPVHLASMYSDWIYFTLE